MNQLNRSWVPQPIQNILKRFVNEVKTNVLNSYDELIMVENGRWDLENKEKSISSYTNLVEVGVALR
jgi:hypothetical protein